MSKMKINRWYWVRKAKIRRVKGVQGTSGGDREG